MNHSSGNPNFIENPDKNSNPNTNADIKINSTTLKEFDEVEKVF